MQEQPSEKQTQYLSRSVQPSNELSPEILKMEVKQQWVPDIGVQLTLHDGGGSCEASPSPMTDTPPRVESATVNSSLLFITNSAMLKTSGRA